MVAPIAFLSMWVAHNAHLIKWRDNLYRLGDKSLTKYVQQNIWGKKGNDTFLGKRHEKGVLPHKIEDDIQLIRLWAHKKLPN